MKENKPSAAELEESSWFVARSDQQTGPYSWNQLHALAAQKELSPSDRVMRQGSAEWQAAESVVGLFASTLSLATADFYATKDTTTSFSVDGAAARPWPKIAGYEILSEIGRGGMGVVYKARQEALGRLVALKMIRSGADADDHERARFQVEAAAVARLRHPHIVQIYEIGVHAGQPFFSLEFVDGGSLAHRLAGAPQPARLAAELIETLARAIHHAHEAGIVHRDLKPANVLLVSNGAVSGNSLPSTVAASSPGSTNHVPLIPKITDFGLAKRLDADVVQTRTGVVVGTPSYMAPEQAAGKTRETGPAADIYAVGAILYEMLTGRPPFKGISFADTVRQVIYEEPVSPSRLQPEVPRDLVTICLKCLRKEPARRYGSALELAEDCRAFLDKQPIRARPTPWMERLWLWCRRHPGVAALSALAVALLVGGAAVSVFFAVEAEEEARIAKKQTALAETRETEAKKSAEHATQQQKIAEEKTIAAEASDRQSRLQLARLLVANGWRHVEEGDVHGGLTWFTEALARERDDVLRARMHRLRIATTLPQGARLDWLAFHPGPVVHAEFRRDGKYVVTAGWDGQVRVWRADTGNPASPWIDHAGRAVHATFSPDSKLIAAASARKLYMWNAGKGTNAFEPQEHEREVLHVTFSPDGTKLATASGWRMAPIEYFDNGRAVLRKGQVRLFDTATGKPIGAALLQDGWVQHVEFHPNGKQLVAAAGLPAKYGPCSAQVWDVDTRRTVGAPMTHPVEILKARYSADGKRIVTAAGDPSGMGEARVWDSQSGEPVTPVLKHDRRVCQAIFSPDGAKVLTGSWDQTARLWDAATGIPLVAPVQHTDHVTDVAWRADGLRFATASRNGLVQVWDTATAKRVLPPLEHGSWVTLVRFNTAGDKLLVATLNGRVHLWDLTGGLVPTQSIALESLGNYAAFHAQGRQVIATGGRPLNHISVATPFDDVTANIVTNQLLIWDHDKNERVAGVAKTAGTLVAFTGDARRFATAVENINPPRYRVQVWDTNTGKPVTPILVHSKEVHGASFHPNGQILVTCSGDKTARFWDVETGLKARPSLVHDDEVQRVYHSPNGRALVTVTSNSTRSAQSKIHFWNATTGEALCPSVEHKDSAVQVAFSSDSKRIVVYHSGRGFRQPSEAIVRDLVSGKAVGVPLKHGGSVLHATFSGDGRLVATASTDTTARVWDAATGQPVGGTLKHSGHVHAVAFSSEGRVVATASADKSARLWDVATGEPLSPPLPHGGNVFSVAFNSEGKELVTASDDKKVRIWSVAPDDRSVEELVELARVLAGRRVDASDLRPLERSAFQEFWNSKVKRP